MMPRKKTVWGKPGQTGVTEDGVPWYVPDKPPGWWERFLYWVSPDDGTGSFPAGARLVPARTAAEVRERTLLKYHDRVAALLPEDEQIDGFIGFALDEHVPQPPGSRLGAKIGPNPIKHWWMGGDWNSLAGRLIIALGGSRTHDLTGPSVMDRNRVWVRTDHRIVIMAGGIDNPLWIETDFGLDQVGLRPGWQFRQFTGERRQVDIAFIDGSWLGLQGYDLDVPGSTEELAEAALLAELAGPSVTAACLPARGRG
jgi:hypothetical protein